MSDLEALAFEAERLASISYRLADSLLGSPRIGADGLREYRFNGAQVEDLLYLLGQQADAAAAIDREAKLIACQPRYVRMSQQLGERLIAHGAAKRAWDAAKASGTGGDAEWEAYSDAEDAFLAEPCRTIVDTQIKLRVVIDLPEMQEGLIDRNIAGENGALVFIRSLMPEGESPSVPAALRKNGGKFPEESRKREDRP